MTKYSEFLFIAACLPLGCSAAPAKPTPTKETAAAPGQYPDSTDGLKKLSEDILAAVKSKDQAKAAGLIQSLAVPNSPQHFKRIFGDDLGGKVADEYLKQAPEQEKELTKVFEECLQKNRTQVSVKRIESPEEKEGTGLQQQALRAMKEKTPLYTVRFTSPGESAGLTLWSFAYLENSFRLLGKMRFIMKNQER